MNAVFHTSHPARRLPFLLVGLLLPGIAAAASSAMPVPSARPAAVAEETKTLAQALAERAGPLGVAVRIAPGLEDDPVPAASAGRAVAPVPPGAAGAAWPDALRQLLQGYNYSGAWDAKGRLVAVSVAGRNGDGAEPPAAQPASGLLSYRKPPTKLPETYRLHAVGSVYAITIDADRLRRMKKGERITVDLPAGRFTLVHDNRWRHPNGEETWVGYVEGAGGLYRVLLTLGDSGAQGQIRTPSGLYTVESEGAGEWLVDMNAAGLRPGASEADGRVPPVAGPGAGNLPQMAAAPTAKAGTGQARRAGTLDAQGKTVLDLLVLYTGGLNSDPGRTQINSAVALANQALADSGAQSVLRLVATRVVKYPDGGANETALDDLTLGTRGLNGAGKFRNRFGADLVILMRPFRPQTQGGCGIAWVNGADGTPLAADLAFGVVGYGAAGGYYCSNYALAHEIGHVLGATHDRQHASDQGRYPYSYGYGKAGEFGDIMSYYDPETGLYANPRLVACDGQPCGIPAGRPKSADVVRTFNNSAPTVSGFRRAPR